MTHATTSQPNLPVLSNRLLVAAFSGLVAGLAAALLDVGQAATILNTSTEILLVLLQATARVGLLGAVLGLFTSLIIHAGGALGERLGRPRTRIAVWVATIVASPGLFYIAMRLFQGDKN